MNGTRITVIITSNQMTPHYKNMYQHISREFKTNNILAEIHGQHMS